MKFKVGDEVKFHHVVLPETISLIENKDIKIGEIGLIIRIEKEDRQDLEVKWTNTSWWVSSKEVVYVYKPKVKTRLETLVW